MRMIRGWFAHAWLTLLVAGLVVAADQWTKTLVRANLPKFDFVPVLGQFFGWQHVDNHGASFGLFRDGRWILTIVAVAVIVAILVYVRSVPRDRIFMRVVLGLMVGGALGNLIDRVARGYVTDFIVIRIPDVYAWPNFNVADTAVVSGTILLAIYIIWDDMRSARAKTQDHLPSND